MTAEANLIEIDAQGTLHADAETLSKLKNQRFTLSMQGQTITLQPAPRHLSEMKDPAERRQALRDLLDQLAIAQAPSWPENYNLRDDIYD